MILELSEKEFNLIQALRKAPAYSDFEIMVRPSRGLPYGEIVRVECKAAIDLSTPIEKAK